MRQTVRATLSLGSNRSQSHLAMGAPLNRCCAPTNALQDLRETSCVPSTAASAINSLGRCRMP